MPVAAHEQHLTSADWASGCSACSIPVMTPMSTLDTGPCSVRTSLHSVPKHLLMLKACRYSIQECMPALSQAESTSAAACH